MKRRVAIVIALLLTVTASAFAQSDLVPLAVVKVNKNNNEVITLKALKARTAFLLKQYEAYGKTSFTTDEKKQILDNLVSEKLVLQKAALEQIVTTDTQVDATFLNTFSQQLGRQVTEVELGAIIKESTGQTLDDYIKAETGMTLTEYKAYLKSQLTVQQYVLSKKQSELSTITASDDEIRKVYDMNKAQFVRNDMMKIFVFGVPKSVDSTNATVTDYRSRYVANPSIEDSIKLSGDNGKKYQAGTAIIPKTQSAAQQLGFSIDQLTEMFGKETGYVSPVNETATDYQFYAVLKKYDAKMLDLSDVYQPDTTITVYDYIRSQLTAQKQNQFLMSASQQLADELNTPENVEWKKSGDDLTKLLNW